MATIPERPGDADRFIDGLITYLRAADPGLVAGFEGASPQDITAYCAASRAFGADLALPPAYGAFLRRMGRRHGDLFKADQQFAADLGTILGMYEEALNWPDTINSAFPIVGCFIIGDEIAFDLASDPQDPEIVVSNEGEPFDWMSGSWAQFLMQNAINYAERRLRKRAHWYSSSAASAGRAIGEAPDPIAEVGRRLDDIIAQLGLEREWPSDARHRAAFGEDTVLAARISRAGEVMLRVFSDDPSVFGRVADAALSVLGASGREIL